MTSGFLSSCDIAICNHHRVLSTSWMNYHHHHNRHHHHIFYHGTKLEPVHLLLINNSTIFFLFRQNQKNRFSHRHENRVLIKSTLGNSIEEVPEYKSTHLWLHFFLMKVMIVYSFVRSLVCSFFRSSVRSFVLSFIWSSSFRYWQWKLRTASRKK